MIARALLALCVGFLSAQTAAAQSLTDAVGGSFMLTDHTGAARTEVDPDGQPQLLFFGYANCQEICSAVFPTMASIVDILAEDGTTLRPLMITVDPDRDTVDTMAEALHVHHPTFVGLTGTEDALQAAYEAYSVEFEELFVDPFYGTVFSHGSFIYLLDGNGTVLTLLPPVLGPEMMAQIVSGYLNEAS
ncbi:SCO family protein [Rhodobacteraceae bacterium N5(2021)]|uniref:SCO family protein n=1 Tax=Gymnodinialimonas phycosphaerae TaxID=2841589 RepID=A0A975YHP7_9RHOB|nr:SCO family protein [Gymnodinialimonas phycosphaerae]MBY4892989.1 SCO family protein [Gymnodinialimonas phycosphaerae]